MLGKRQDKMETFVGSNTRIRGEAEVKGSIRIDGRYEGNIRSDWVVIGEKGYMKGDIFATGVIVGGTVEGNIVASESLEIKSKGSVVGDVQTKKLTIIEGGIFQGRSIMKDEKKIVELEKKTSPIK